MKDSQLRVTPYFLERTMSLQPNEQEKTLNIPIDDEMGLDIFMLRTTFVPMKEMVRFTLGQWNGFSIIAPQQVERGLSLNQMNIGHSDLPFDCEMDVGNAWLLITRMFAWRNHASSTEWTRKDSQIYRSTMEWISTLGYCGLPLKANEKDIQIYPSTAKWTLTMCMTRMLVSKIEWKGYSDPPFDSEMDVGNLQLLITHMFGWTHCIDWSWYSDLPIDVEMDFENLIFDIWYCLSLLVDQRVSRGSTVQDIQTYLSTLTWISRLFPVGVFFVRVCRWFHLNA